jgi:rod shape-determining protein MreC
MQTLILFLYRIRAFLLFLGLQAVCFWLIFSNNPYQSAGFFNSSNQVAGQLLEVSSQASEYLDLANQNEFLAMENARINRELQNLKKQLEALKSDSLAAQVAYDSTLDAGFNYIPAKVINQSIRNRFNYITINRGTKHGISRDMGIISSTGVVGKVKAVSENFATITSILHTDLLTSAKIGRNGAVGSVRWDGKDPRFAQLLYIPRHIEVSKGDTLLTAGYSGIYPEGVLIGQVEDISVTGEATYYTIKVKLSTEFSKLNWVYAVSNKNRPEKQNLEEENFTSGD